MKKEDWINSILESTTEINKVEANSFLYHKILNKVNHSKKASVPNLKFRLGWAVAISIVIAFNVSAFVIYKSKINRQNESLAIDALSDELISGTKYNY